MNAIETVLDRMGRDEARPALVWRGRTITYGRLLEMAGAWRERFRTDDVGAGTVCGVLGDYSPESSALLVALMQANAILVPFTRHVERELPALVALAGVQRLFRVDSDDAWSVEIFPPQLPNPLVATFRARGTPGLIVFTSGSTGRPKGILHDCECVARKFVAERPGWRTILFLMVDHFGGFNTLLSTFAYGGTAVSVPDRMPDTVCRIIEQSRATLLPTTPTFLNLLIASGCHRGYDLSSLQMITYGTEVMAETTLQQIRMIFPNARIKQTYGLSEVGVLHSISESDGSVWVKVGGNGFDVKVVDDVLWVRSEANMVGYLNAPSPFDSDGWMCTSDQVEVRGEYMRVLGRTSELINVGGQKVLPIEVETTLLKADNVREATVYGVRHPLMGQVAHARVSLHRPEDPEALAERLRTFCVERMARYKVPVRFTVVGDEEQHNERFKKLRAAAER